MTLFFNFILWMVSTKQCLLTRSPQTEGAGSGIVLGCRKMLKKCLGRGSEESQRKYESISIVVAEHRPSRRGGCGWALRSIREWGSAHGVGVHPEATESMAYSGTPKRPVWRTGH